MIVLGRNCCCCSLGWASRIGSHLWLRSRWTSSRSRFAVATVRWHIVQMESYEPLIFNLWGKFGLYSWTMMHPFRSWICGSPCRVAINGKRRLCNFAHSSAFLCGQISVTLDVIALLCPVCDIFRGEALRERCFQEKDSNPPACGIHHVQLVQTDVPIDQYAPYLGKVPCLRCPVSGSIATDVPGPSSSH